MRELHYFTEISHFIQYTITRSFHMYMFILANQIQLHNTVKTNKDMLSGQPRRMIHCSYRESCSPYINSFSKFQKYLDLLKLLIEKS
ncbi:hypothetical protein H5410_060749 [Solanum commersonii]|uniref:Uncharacterized protein n=1 Tax=Solanum commersonii TaxID=4109 RepID=A0A9J5W6L0_SOLCO|nr:hypothetical protein H5410_060749 [Solanum commersonii]